MTAIIPKLSIKINVKDFNLVLKDEDLLKKLTSLTLSKNVSSISGMRYEIEQLTNLAKNRQVNARAILAKSHNQIVGWSLLSREASRFYTRTNPFGELWFNPVKHGMLFELFVDKDFRRMGIGTKLIKTARKIAAPYPLAICPWDYSSRKFYNNFDGFYHYEI